MNIKPRWKINDPLHGSVTIIPGTIRYSRNRWHPYGWELSFSCKVLLPDGSRKERAYGATGVDRSAAMANALPR